MSLSARFNALVCLLNCSRPERSPNSEDRPGLLTGAAVDGASEILEIVYKVAQPILVWPAMLGSRPTYQPVDRSPLRLSIHRTMGISLRSQPARATFQRCSKTAYVWSSASDEFRRPAAGGRNGRCVVQRMQSVGK